MTTLALEFATLSNLTGDARYGRVARAVYDVLPTQGLLPQFFSPYTGQAVGAYYMLGARTDSYYEYLLKYWILMGKSDDAMKRRYRAAMDAVHNTLLDRTHGPRGALFVSELTLVNAPKASEEGRGPEHGLLGSREERSPKMDHLVCFLPGVLVLGHWHGAGTHEELERDIMVARDLLDTCVSLYDGTPTGLAGEISHLRVSEDGEYGHFDVLPGDDHNILRPETIESLFVMWAVTGEQRWQEAARRILERFERHCRCGVSGTHLGEKEEKRRTNRKKEHPLHFAYCGIQSVKATDEGVQWIDKMESFWMAETLKYFYMMFDGDQWRDRILNGQWVLNTEAHFLKTL
jgi:hypothetical protein